MRVRAVFVGASIGIANGARTTASNENARQSGPATPISCALKTRAKADGNGVHTFQRCREFKATDTARERRLLEMDPAQGDDRGRGCIYDLPIPVVDSGERDGSLFEALGALEIQPTRGPVFSRASIIPIAEEIGLIRADRRMVLRNRLPGSGELADPVRQSPSTSSAETVCRAIPRALFVPAS
jgi:predicted signal transduction protein with EAL and GGDEF domain